MTGPVSSRRAEIMTNIYGGNPKQNMQAVGFQEGFMQLLGASATPFLMFGVPAMGAKTAGAVLGSTAYRYYGYAKHPILSAGKHYGVRGASTTLSLVKAYGKFQTGVGILYYKKNLQLAQQREWKRLGINVFGPPGSLYMYDRYLADTSTSKQEETDLVEAIKEQSGGGSSLPSKPKPPGTLKPSTKKFLSGTTPYAYKPKSDERCRKGYKSVIKSGRRMCVKID